MRQAGWAWLVLGVLLRAAAAYAEPAAAIGARSPAAAPHPGLNWVRLEGASECVSAAELALDVESRLGRALFVASSEADLFVDGWVARGATGFDVVVEVSDREGAVLGHRSMHVEGDDCKAIEPAVALVIAVTLYPNSALPAAGIALDPGTAERLDSLFGAEPLEPDPATMPAAPAASEVAEVDRATADGGSAAPELGHIALLALGVAPTLALGQLPSPAFGLSGYVLVTPRGAFPLEVGIAYLPAVRARSEVGVGQADFELWLGSLALCPWRPSWPVAFDVCLGVEAGRLQVAADGFVTDNVRTRDPVLNLRVGVAFQLPLVGPLFARGSLHASVPLLQRNYTYRAEDNMSVSLFRMPQAALRAELGLGIAL